MKKREKFRLKIEESQIKVMKKEIAVKRKFVPKMLLSSKSSFWKLNCQ